jgi:FkbM family methyltransferase
MLNLNARAVSISESDFLEFILGSNSAVNPIYIFGAGSATQNLLPFLNKYHVPVVAILDNRSPEIQQLFGIKVLPPTESIYKSSTKVVVLVKNNREDIARQLIGLGFDAKDIVFPQINALDFYTLIYQWYYPDQELDNRKQEIEAALASYADEQSRQLFLHRLGLFTQGLDYRNYLAFLNDFSYPILNYHPHIENPENYFYFNNEIISNDYELFIDLGGHDGESTRQFLKRSNGEVDQIYIAEPDPIYYLKLIKEFSHYKENITIIKKAAWSCITKLKFEQNGPQSTIRESGTSTVSTFTVDSLELKGKHGLIKMDIEGAETSALVGCAKTLRENHFDLIISAYHKKDDFITLTNYLSTLQIRYKYYLRHFGAKIYETCIIAKRF